MLNNSKNEGNEFIQQIANKLGKPDLNKFKTDINKVKNKAIKSNFITTFLSKYNTNLQIDSKICQQMFYDIILRLINLRIDFEPIMKIYMLTTDEMKSDILRNHFVLNEKKTKKVGNEDENNNPYIEIWVDLSCTYDEESYYKKFIKGVFNYFKLVIKENYLYKYFKKQYYLNLLNEYSSYKDNKSSLENSLKNLLNDMSRIINEQGNKIIVKNNKPKMSKDKYGVFRIRIQLHKNNKISEIYEKNDNNDDILKAIDTLLKDDENEKDEELYLKLLAFREDIYTYIQQEKKNNENNKEKKQTSLNNLLIYDNEKENKYLCKINNRLNTLGKQLKDGIGELQNNINNLTNKVTQLEGKVGFMEPIVLSLICRKAINHCIIKTLEKYKSKIKVTKIFSYNKFKYKIIFIDSVNAIDIVNFNCFIDNLFCKKDDYNQDLHLNNLDLSILDINDLWNLIKKTLKLNHDEKIIFDTIFTTDIKSCFDFTNEDLSVENYLKNIDINEFEK